MHLDANPLTHFTSIGMLQSLTLKQISGNIIFFHFLNNLPKVFFFILI